MTLASKIWAWDHPTLHREMEVHHTSSGDYEFQVYDGEWSYITVPASQVAALVDLLTQDLTR